MQNIRRYCVGLLTAVALCGVAGLGIYRALADEVPEPVITIALTGTNEVTITITNGVSWANYELYRRTFLDPVYPWALHSIGAQGQTNFVAEIGVFNMSFFEVAVGNDWDQDGIPNYKDANPTDSDVGALAITIDSPLNGTVFE